MEKAASTYFLVIVLPAVGVGLYGEFVANSFLQLPPLSPEDPDYSPPAYLIGQMVGLAFLMFGGIALLSGYWRRVFRPRSSRSRIFWWFSAGYNAMLFFAFGAWLYRAGRPPEIDWSMVLFYLFF